MDGYLLLKSLHVLGAVIFLGNILVSALWKVLADRTRHSTIVAHAQRLVTITDFAFTALGVGLIIVTGELMAGRWEGATWVGWGRALFVASGVIWLVPIQLVQARMARAFANQESIPAAYWRLANLWGVFGIVATVLPLLNLYFMVCKPA
ncbi:MULTISPECIES: DUF2269 family protein [unclassified Meiothermus]|uniref:DUF2269 family protein n=1 Tax=unclassified Meiothermus TaxID=370471 RepID=UPI000D7B9E16|nr:MULTISPECIES: DUF2269 family protein [unclassified Meiothermus]PZA06647.1 DUF2269 domain-containing protein [Meiothermus sp. Pnk-1]RYM37681.1 DUF2269 family protein [Meiothermus sp. PNK-Is4]